MISVQDFKCIKCGDCCKFLIVKVGKRDIDKIKKAGYDDFFGMDSHIRDNVLKRDDEGCVFLAKKGKEYFCRIYEIRPKVCKDYPFVNSSVVESCKPVLLGR